MQDCPNGLDESICSSSSDDDKDDNSNNVPSFGGGDNDDGDGVNDYEYFIPENEDETGYIDEGWFKQCVLGSRFVFIVEPTENFTTLIT